MTQSPTVTVVIPTAGGRAELLERSIGTLLEDPATSEVIVVIDGAAPETEAVVRRYSEGDQRVKLTQPPATATPRPDRGQWCRDWGARVASSQVVLSLDDDVEPDPGLVSGHAARHASSESLVVMGYMPVVSPRVRAGAVRATARLYSTAYERACAPFRQRPDQVLEGLWTGNLSLRRAHWLGAANETSVYAAYHEDRQFGLRLRAIGLTGIFDPGLRAKHWYRRTASEAAKDAVSSGLGQALLCVEYPELNESDPDQTLRPDSVRRRILWWCARSRLGWSLASRSLVLAANAAALCRLPGLEYASVRTLREIGFARGVQQVTRGAAPDPWTTAKAARA